MPAKKTFCVTIRLRPLMHADYRQLHFYIKVGGVDANYLQCPLGIHMLRADWTPYLPAHERQAFSPATPLEQKLDAVWNRLHQIYANQLGRAKAEGWTVSAKTIKREYLGKTPIPIARPRLLIAPCQSHWRSVSSQSFGTGGAVAMLNIALLVAVGATPPAHFYRPLTTERIEAAQNLLLSLAEGFNSLGNSAPMVKVGDLVNTWLTTPSCDLLVEATHNDLWQISSTIDALTQLLKACRSAVSNGEGGQVYA